MGVGFDNPRSAPAGDADRDLLENVAAQCALALDRARLADAAERDQEQLAFLDEISGTLSSQPERRHGAHPAGGDGRAPTRRLVRGAPHGHARQPSTPRWARPTSIPLRWGRLTRLVHRLPTRPGGGGRARRGAGRRTTAHPGGARRRHARPAVRRPPATARPWPRSGVDALAVFPLQARGRLLGVIAFGDRPGRPFSDADVALATAVASRAGGHRRQRPHVPRAVGRGPGAAGQPAAGPPARHPRHRARRPLPGGRAGARRGRRLLRRLPGRPQLVDHRRRRRVRPRRRGGRHHRPRAPHDPLLRLRRRHAVDPAAPPQRDAAAATRPSATRSATTTCPSARASARCSSARCSRPTTASTSSCARRATRCRWCGARRARSSRSASRARCWA